MSPSALPSTSRRPSYWPWACATVGLALILAFSLGGFYVLQRVFSTADRLAGAPGALAASLAEAFRPEVHYETKIYTAIGELKNTPKLVVLTADVDAEVNKSSSTKWGYIYFGTTNVAVRAHHNKIQWIVPLESVSAADFHYDLGRKTLTLEVAAPVVDPEMVSVQSDPSQIEISTDVGWAKLDRWSGTPLRQDAKRALRPAVVAAGRHQLLEERARVNATMRVEKILAPLVGTLAPGTSLQIKFKPPSREK